MKYNEKQFLQSTTEPFETQEMNNGSIIELHYMNDEPFFMENINKSRFLAWSSVDGKNYKLFLEKGFFEETKDLYTKDVNEIWMKFWDKVSLMKRRYLLFFMLPFLAISFSVLIILSLLFPNKALPIICGFVGVLIISLFASSTLSKKMQVANINAASEVRDCIGLEKFKEILERQDKYIEKFYNDLQAKYEEEDRLAEEQENLDQIEADENDESIDEDDSEVIDAEIIEEDKEKEE